MKNDDKAIFVLRIPLLMRRDLKVAAAILGKSMTTLVQEAIRQVIADARGRSDWDEI